MIKVYQVNGDLIFLHEGQLMARLPSGAIYITSGRPNEIQITLERLGARFKGEINGPFNASDFDYLTRLVREISGGSNEPLH